MDRYPGEETAMSLDVMTSILGTVSWLLNYLCQELTVQR